MTMSTILFYKKAQLPRPLSAPIIRWLTPEDFDAFNQHLLLAGHKPIAKADWHKNHLSEAASYCGHFKGSLLVGRAAVERWTLNCWDVSDVRVLADHRGQGIAQALCTFVTNFIHENEKTATIHTEADNAAMLRVIEKLGFERL